MMNESSRKLISLALALSVEDWMGLGHDESSADTGPTWDNDVLVERGTALLLMRCVAMAAPLGVYTDLSTSTICRTLLMEQASDNNDHNFPTTKEGEKWPASITASIVDQAHEFVKRMFKGYKDVPYHNAAHAFHVTLSMNKLIDMMIQNPEKSRTFGLKNDALALMALIFSALVHDVEHQGVPNRQLAMENDRLAVLYNDQSIAENWSLYVAFSEFLQDDFKDLRAALFPAGEDYRRFRKLVIDLVLTTDIASPERTQLVKSKWKEAFGDPFETVERKMRAESRRQSLTGRDVSTSPLRRFVQHRRGTGDVSELSMGDSADFMMHSKSQTALEESPSISPENSESNEDNVDPQTTTSSYMRSNHMNIEMLRRSTSGTITQRQRNGGVGRQSFSGSTLERRLSTTSRSTAASKYRVRTGILRTVDLSGETLEAYQRNGSMALSTHSSQFLASSTNQSSSGGTDGSNGNEINNDEPNELKETVVMETLITAADVAHLLQGWEPMVKWSGLLYMELRKAYSKERMSGNPEIKWFENQIGFLESYLLPLARKLEDTGVFGSAIGESFALTIEANRDRWLTEGFDEAEKVIARGAEKYPMMNGVSRTTS